jgi:carboxylesterase type B
MLGWTALPDSDMDPNVGLHDAVAAVEWTKKYISRFGGDPTQITVMGESAGGAIINLMLTGNGGRGDLPFQQICSQLEG